MMKPEEFFAELDRRLDAKMVFIGAAMEELRDAQKALPEQIRKDVRECVRDETGKCLKEAFPQLPTPPVHLSSPPVVEMKPETLEMKNPSQEIPSPPKPAVPAEGGGILDDLDI